MRKLTRYKTLATLLIVYLVFAGYSGVADDTCIFMVTSDDVQPNIVFLLDNGAVMEHIVWHSGFDNKIDYTPALAVADQCDVIGGTSGAPPAASNPTLIYGGAENYLHKGVRVIGWREAGSAFWSKKRKGGKARV